MKKYYRYIKGQFNQFVVRQRIKAKWLKDVKKLPLTGQHFELYSIIHQLTHKELGRFPDLVECKDYNDKIQWLKLFDQGRDVVICSDKIKVKEYARKKLGVDCSPQIYQVASKFEDVDVDSLPSSFVVKSNHDSGTVILVENKESFDWAFANVAITKSLSRVYGVEKGEWAYAMIEPKVLVEEYIDSGSDNPPPDYKFHCVDGTVRWLQYIYNRGGGAKEIIVMPNGHETDIRFDHNMISGAGFEKPQNWKEMIVMAEKLSVGFKYVRVDLYRCQNRVLLGEMTFYPLKGCYKGGGQIKLGRLLDFDRSKIRPVYAVAEEVA